MQNIIRKKNIHCHFILIGLCFILLHCSQEVLRAQTYSSEEIVISGLGFTRFAVALEPQPAFSEHPEAPRWERIIDRNLCWSGSFKVRGSRYASCRLGEGSRLDMKILLDVQNQQLILTVADVEGVPLFPFCLLYTSPSPRDS